MECGLPRWRSVTEWPLLGADWPFRPQIMEDMVGFVSFVPQTMEKIGRRSSCASSNIASWGRVWPSWAHIMEDIMHVFSSVVDQSVAIPVPQFMEDMVKQIVNNTVDNARDFVDNAADYACDLADNTARGADCAHSSAAVTEFTVKVTSGPASPVSRLLLIVAAWCVSWGDVSCVAPLCVGIHTAVDPSKICKNENENDMFFICFFHFSDFTLFSGVSWLVSLKNVSVFLERSPFLPLCPPPPSTPSLCSKRFHSTALPGAFLLLPTRQRSPRWDHATKPQEPRGDSGRG